MKTWQICFKDLGVHLVHLVVGLMEYVVLIALGIIWHHQKCKKYIYFKKSFSSISEELRLGFEKDPAFKGMVAVARGFEQHNIRARLGETELSVEEQVDCLIDQATDPNILGRTYAGWEPWM